MVHIGFDYRPMQTAHKYRGIGRHTANIQQSLKRISEDVAFSYLVYDDIVENDKKQLEPYRHLITAKQPGDFNRYSAILNELLHTDKEIAKLNVDLFHYQMQVPPIKHSRATVITIYDFITRWLGRKGTSIRERFNFRLQSRSSRNADGIITISQSSKRDIVKYAGIHPDKIHICYCGCSKNYHPVKDVDAVTQKYNLPGRFILYSGAVDYRKNPKGLLRIYRDFANGLNSPPPLVMVGKPEYFHEVRRYWYEIGMQNKKARLLFTGFVDDDDLPAIYSAATVFVFPSLYEGFGLPLIESMACGTPVIAYDNSSVSEIVENWGVLIENENEREFADILTELYGSEKLQKHYSVEGLKRAKYFTWENTARKTLDVYDRVLKCG